MHLPRCNSINFLITLLVKVIYTVLLTEISILYSHFWKVSREFELRTLADNLHGFHCISREQCRKSS